MERKISFYKHYFFDIYSKQNLQTKVKIDFVLDLIRNVERVPSKFLKSLEGTEGIYEIQIHTQKKNIHFFCFFDLGSLIIVSNCSLEKSEKIPKTELEYAKKLRTEYFSLK
jgi:hypothetical protein